MGKLIRLELYNFKSYKGHHCLLFGDSYFTSIVGPNGSGKSNSMDAISFVLGIRSSHLRSAQLRELVYRGRVLKAAKINDDGSAVDAAAGAQAGAPGEERASHADPRNAWVMAVYVDDAGEEVRWKRSITSQGTSDYRIDDRVVTAQQYNEALERENILIKARNFLVFQGDIEAIAAQSPQDLIKLIEQISGSLEYKSDFERLHDEYQHAQDQLTFLSTRRRGINSEVRQYQEQKREADNYQKKVNRRDGLITTQYLWRLYHKQRVMDESSVKIREHREALKEFFRTIEAFEKKLESARRGQAAAVREAGRVEKEIRAREKTAAETENTLVPVVEKVDQCTREAERNEKRTDEIAAERDGYAELIRKVRKDLADVEKARDRFDKAHRERVKQQGREVGDDDRRRHDALRAGVLARTSADNAQLDNLRRQLKTDEATTGRLRSKYDGAAAQSERFGSEIAETGKKRAAAEAVRKELEDDIQAKKKAFNLLQSEQLQKNRRRTELEEKLEDLTRKLREADDGRTQRDRQARRDGTVASLKRAFPGVKGVVGKLCKPKQSKYDDAVAIALGRDFDSIVVDTGKTAIDCVHHLKENRLPPATFIPLDNIMVHNLNTAVRGIPGARLTIDVIDYDPAHARALEYACGSSVVCDSLDVARHICYDKGMSVKAVTLEGIVIHKAGLMTGGRMDDGRNKRRRFEEQDVENLERTVAQLQGELQRMPRADRRDPAQESLQTELQGLAQRLPLVREELAALEKNLDSKIRERDDVERQLAEWAPGLGEMEAGLEKTRATAAGFEDAIAGIEDEVFADFCRKLGYANIREYEAQQGSLEQEVAEERAKFELQKQRLRSTLSAEEARHDGAAGRIERLRARHAALRRDLAAYEDQRRGIETALGGERDELEALRRAAEECREELDRRTRAVADAKAELQKRSKAIDGRQKEVGLLEAALQQSRSTKFNLLQQCQLERVRLPLAAGSRSLDHLPGDDVLHPEPEPDPDPDAMDENEPDGATGMNIDLDDYGIVVDFDGLDEELKASDDAIIGEGLQEKVNSMNIEIENMHPNMRAAERLGLVEEKLKTVDKECEASRQETKAARDAFNQVRTKRLELFSKAFSHIREQIADVYKELTRSDAYPLGGQAYLDLDEDSKAPFVAGIKYHVMPPLKRFRDMEHLSGGEKTIAALALLFAIHSYQPSPFFVLDEVDAALDNANVAKIRKYIREHAGPGMQFIVISLKAGLFQESESLVGVYRDQKMNSSRTLTLDLRKYA